MKFMIVTVGFGLAGSVGLAQTPEQQARFDRLELLFENADLVAPPEMVDCTLSGGEESLCISMTARAAPANHTTGPYCPSTIETPPEESGTWFFKEEVVPADGEFIKNLAVLFEDDKWQMFDPDTGEVIRVEGELGCEVAGDPESAPDYENYCVECEVKYLNEDTSETYVIPLAPIMSEGEGEDIGPAPGVGLALNGVKLDAPAPLDLIEGNYSLGLMDACVGHVNPYAGYHYHGLVGCEPAVAATIEDHEPQVAVAMDGFDIYATVVDEQAANLDTCNGHEVDGLGYHYHVDKAGTNQFIGCFKAQYGCTLSDASATCDATTTSRRGPPPRD